MSNQFSANAHHIGDDEKLTPVMLYTSHTMVWGKVFSKIAIRVSTWLNTEMAPSYMKIYDAQILTVGGSGAPAPVKHPILHLQTGGINALHMMPPFSEDVDYDPDEPNRKLVPVTALLGNFCFNGFIRMAEMTTMDNYLAAAKGEFLSIYDITMTCPSVPSIKGIKAPMLLLRQGRVTFAQD